MFQAGSLRIAKVNPNNLFGSGPIKQWYHVDCFFDLKKTKTSKILSSADDVDGWDLLSKEDKDLVVTKAGDDFKEVTSSPKNVNDTSKTKADSRDNKFSEFQRIVKKIANEPSYNNKSQILQKFLREVNQSFNCLERFKSSFHLLRERLRSSKEILSCGFVC